MASLYKRGGRFWIAYYHEGKLVQKSLRTANNRVARDKKRKIEYELAIGDLHAVSNLPLPPVLEAFCSHLQTIRTRKSYKNDVSRLRVFFGPIAESLKPGIPGDKTGKRHAGPVADKYDGAHVRARLLEDVTPEAINRFIAERLKKDGWSAKTATSEATRRLHTASGLGRPQNPHESGLPGRCMRRGEPAQPFRAERSPDRNASQARLWKATPRRLGRVFELCALHRSLENPELMAQGQILGEDRGTWQENRSNQGNEHGHKPHVHLSIGGPMSWHRSPLDGGTRTT